MKHSSLSLLCFCLGYLGSFWFHVSMAQNATNATTDPSEGSIQLYIFFASGSVNKSDQLNSSLNMCVYFSVSALNSIFQQWGAQSVALWNISGEPCSGSAINGTAFESTPNNPAITCDCTFDNSTTCHITQLRVYALDKTGGFPEELLALKYLKFLKIDQNFFTGPLPAWIGNMSALTLLSIAHNAFSGPIPKELGNLKDLNTLSFGSNNFSGTLPPELGNLIKLQQLYIDSCGLTGEIPSTFANLRNMQVLWASGTPFSGKIPDFIGNWTKLNSLRISDIYNGSSSLGFIKNLKNLTDLVLRNALITGSLPSDIAEYPRLQILDLSFNNLTGQLPNGLFNMSSLTYLDLSYNYLSGSLPPWVTSTAQLLPGLNCLQRNFPCNRNAPRYANFSIKCGGQELRGSDGILYEAENSTLGPATFSVTSTEKWAVSNAGLFADRKNPDYVVNTLAQVTGTDVTPELFQTSRLSPGSLRYFGLGLENGPYTVTLQFAETVFLDRTLQTWKSLGRRLFDIYIQGDLKWKDFDISKEAGGVFRAVARNFNVNVSENYLDIHLFWAGKGTCCIPEQGDYGPLISAVKVVPEFTPTVSGIPPTTPGKKSKTGLIVGIAVPLGVVGLLLIFSVLYLRRKKAEKYDDEGNKIFMWSFLMFEKHGTLICSAEKILLMHCETSNLLALENRPNTFSYSELKEATAYFNPSNKLGEGGYGPVYKGTLSDGRVVAVKQLSVASHQGKSQFGAEIATISAVQHRNLVKLYGCCIEGSQRILVYEYLENKSLDQALFGTNDLHLDWLTRFNIMLGTARGLAYLHEESSPRIVHRDVKASNILLDTELCPKISDFGLAKLYDDDKTHISTRVAGTIGYLAPEYAMRGHLTEKADVFSFGVVVLEILSGRPNADSDLDAGKTYLLEWAWTLHENNKTLELVDPRLTDFDDQEAIRFIKVAFQCTQGPPMTRPSMSRVVGMLSGDIEVGSTVMSKPSYLTDWDYKDVTTSSFLIDRDTPSTDSKSELNLQPGSTTGASTDIDLYPSHVEVNRSMVTDIIREGR
ncbi:putative transferase, protein kinase RLK-Pelle-DLSV family [Rosa chinensis]|uniref:non-specific serine/threonine protein kinase n=1 Tax=Rosa chinensis TaxID=74649 RepID=A0A2P6Q6U8_ROSCH|nr:putative transferase, protein kinase RLK-Pelle-DLSV family [Rosa chinensis]